MEAVGRGKANFVNGGVIPLGYPRSQSSLVAMSFLAVCHDTACTSAKAGAATDHPPLTSSGATSVSTSASQPPPHGRHLRNQRRADPRVEPDLCRQRRPVTCTSAAGSDLSLAGAVDFRRFTPRMLPPAHRRSRADRLSSRMVAARSSPRIHRRPVPARPPSSRPAPSSAKPWRLHHANDPSG